MKILLFILMFLITLGWGLLVDFFVPPHTFPMWTIGCPAVATITYIILSIVDG